jgi:hypothetical protein
MWTQGSSICRTSVLRVAFAVFEGYALVVERLGCAVSFMLKEN